MGVACVVIAYTTDNLLILLNRVHNPLGLGLPGGKLEGDETPLQCAQRELFEEVNIKLEENELEYTKVDVSENGSTIHVFKALKAIDMTTAKHSNEHTAIVTVPFSFLEYLKLAGNTLSFLT